MRRLFFFCANLYYLKNSQCLEINTNGLSKTKKLLPGEVSEFAARGQPLFIFFAGLFAYNAPIKMWIFSFKIPASLMYLVIFRHCCIQFFFCWEKEEWMKSWKSIGLLDTFLSAQWIAWYFRCFVCVFGIFGVSAICQILQLWHLFQLPKRQSCTQKPSDENDGNFSIFLFYISSRVGMALLGMRKNLLLSDE